jgi:Bacterial Ig-like domain
MGLNKKAVFSFKILMVLAIVAFIFGCASMQKPQGGPKDRTPPKLLKATPPNMTRNFAAKEIRLDFDEFFNLKNAFQEITISPTQEKIPTYKVSKKSIVIDFKDTLQKNTTYVINFGKAIADVNEGNILNNFTYVFSTGPHIDSLSISGSVQNTLTGEKEKDATVMLLTLKQDSTIFGKKKPTIYTTTDSAGNFSLNNLHVGDYRIYALKETSPNKIYDKDDELIGFLKKTIHLRKDTSNIHLSLFRQDPEKLRKIEGRFDLDGKMYFTFNKGLDNPSVKILYPPGLDQQKIVEFSKTRDTANIYMRNMDFDSIKVSFLQTNKPFDTLVLRKGRKETYDRTFKLLYNVSDNVLKPTNDLIITNNLPIESFDQSLITLNEDSTNISTYTLVKDTGNAKKLILKYRWKPNSRYQLVFNEGSLTNIYGDKNKKLAPKIFQGDKLDNYGQLSLKINIPDTSKAYVVELLDNQKKIVRIDPVTKNTTLQYKNYPVGKYNVRVIYDSNKNGKWDSGSVKRREYPENIWNYEKIITLRSNWDAEETIDIPKEVTVP